MDGATLTRFPHLSWLGATLSLRADEAPLRVGMRSVAHCLSMTVAGRHAVRWRSRGDERQWTEQAGTLHFRPCDGEEHDFTIHSAESGDVLSCFIPRRHLADIGCAEGLHREFEWHRLLMPYDRVLWQSMLALRSCRESPDDNVSRADDVARRLVLRLVELSGGGVPDWHDDVSVFDRRTLGYIVECIDAHLGVAPSLSDMGMRTGLSPSHFARKFRFSTGLSLQRFVNRRRILAALPRLQDRSQPVAHIAIELGFSSQSHFTRLFSGLTGMTPARFRRQFRPALG